MSTGNDNPTVDMDDLDSFETAFFNKSPKADEPEAKTEEDQTEADEVDEIEDDTLATDEDDDTDEGEEEEEEDEEPEPEPEPKKGKKSAKDRIEELVARNREAERREAALLKRLEALEAPKEVKQDNAPAKPLRDILSEDAPNPDAEDEQGDPLYPLGEFDPKFIRDLTRFTIESETKAAKERDAQDTQQRLAEAAQEELKTSWTAKVTEAEKELPDLREKLTDMTEAFEGIDTNYGEYLAATIMSCDAGPQIMYYLSQNIGEAQKIVASGPAAATLAIGRLEARLTPTKNEEPKRNSTRVSKAPIPPTQRTRGAGSKFTVNADTDDLDAFEREFFKKK